MKIRNGYRHTVLLVFAAVIMAAGPVMSQALVEMTVQGLPVDLQPMQLYSEVLILDRLNELHLDHEQVNGILAIYSEITGISIEKRQEAISELQALRARLLAGGSLTEADHDRLRELARLEGRRGGNRRADRRNIQEAVEQVWALLTPVQQEIILTSPIGLRRPARSGGQQATEIFLRQIAEMRELEEEQWVNQRNLLANLAAAKDGPPGSETRQNRARMLEVFFDRIRDMDHAEFEQNFANLQTELQAVAPPDTDFLAVFQASRPDAYRNAVQRVLLNSTAIGLLIELQEVSEER